VSAFNAIYKRKKWKSWINNSGKADPPPDFYSNEYGNYEVIMNIINSNILRELNKLNIKEKKKRSKSK